MSELTAAGPVRRTGRDTREQIQQIALSLFTTQGYEATSMREIADEASIRKASLYYHFKGKEDILRSLFEQRSNEADELIGWIEAQSRTPELAKVAVLRWVDSFSADKLRGIRFLAVNPLIMRAFDSDSGDRIGERLTRLADVIAELLPDPNPVKVLQLRMALLSINAAVAAASRTPFTDDEILAAAREHAVTVIDELVPPVGRVDDEQ